MLFQNFNHELFINYPVKDSEILDEISDDYNWVRILLIVGKLSQFA